LKIINHFKSGDLKLLIATDVASRGLHVEDVSHVVNYDLPQDREDYVHRIGRTARAGMSGKAISLACDRYVYSLEAIEEYIGKKIPVIWPDESWFFSDKSRKIRSADQRRRGPKRRGPPPGRRGSEHRSRNKRPDGQRSAASSSKRPSRGTKTTPARKKKRRN
ncbi:MAG: helicase-related protein, partial [Syntrophobacteria bacterium]